MLTYTILIKAVISTVLLFCTAAGPLALRSPSASMPLLEVIYVTAQAAGFINIVACVMCLGGIVALSAEFVTTHRIMVIVLIMECVLLLLVTADLGLVSVNKEMAAVAVNTIMLVWYTVEVLLIGAAFLFCMKGFGEVLRQEGDAGSAAGVEKLGAVYFYCNAAGAALFMLTFSGEGIMIVLAPAVLYLSEAVLEFLMYRRISDAAFRIWRKRAFDVSE